MLKQRQDTASVAPQQRVVIPQGFVLGRDGKYCDTMFPASDQILRDKDNPSRVIGLDKGKRVTSWARPRDIHRTPTLFLDGASALDIKQGGLGDCWLLSSLATIAAIDPARIYDLVQFYDEAHGVFAMKLCVFGIWQVITVDDLLPVDASRGRARLAFADAPDGEFWIPLFEKAAAKAFGGYGAIAGGFGAEGLSLFTGGVPDIAKTESVSPDEFWRRYLCRTRVSPDGFVFLLASSRSDANGLVSHHAYSVVGAAEVPSPADGRTVRVIQVRNPWGEKEWTGAWGDDDARRWTPEMRQRLFHRKANDGIFWMAIEDFYRHFYQISVCEVLPAAWETVASVATMCDVAPRSERNPAWRVSAGERPLSVIIVFRAFERDVSGRHSTQRTVFGALIRSERSRRAIANTYSNYSVNFRFDLAAGEAVTVRAGTLEGAPGPFQFVARFITSGAAHVRKLN